MRLYHTCENIHNIVSHYRNGISIWNKGGKGRMENEQKGGGEKKNKFREGERRWERIQQAGNTKLTFEKSDRGGFAYKSISRIKFHDPRGRASLRADALSAELYFSMRLKYLRILAAGEYGNGWPPLLLAKSARSIAKLLPECCS